MKVWKSFALLLALGLTVLAAQAEKKPKKSEVPELMATAKTVAVVSRDGNEFDLRVSDAERLAIVSVRNAMKLWGRYTVVSDVSQADVVLLLRKGKSPQESRGQGRDQSGAGRSTMDLGDHGDALGSLSQARSELTMQQDWMGDSLSICAPDGKGKLGNPLWTRSMEGGLEGPHPLLVDQLHAATDKAFPPATPKT